MASTTSGRRASEKFGTHSIKGRGMVISDMNYSKVSFQLSTLSTDNAAIILLNK